jgi:hypothetical protein
MRVAAGGWNSLLMNLFPDLLIVSAYDRLTETAHCVGKEEMTKIKKIIKASLLGNLRSKKNHKQT